MKLAARAANLAASETMAVSARAAAMRARGIDVISFAAGEPDAPPPPEAIAALTDSLARGETRYPSVLGLPELRHAIAQRFARRTLVPFEADEVVVTTGAKFALWATFQALVGPGDEVVVPTPAWVSYPAQIALAGGRAVSVARRFEDAFRLDPDAIASAITPRTVGLVLNSPHNPTGLIDPPEVLAALAELAIRHDLWIVTDEIYADLYLDGRPAPSILSGRDDLKSRVIVLDGVSKSYALTGFRVGFLTAPAPCREAVGKLLSQTTSGVSTFVQRAALAAINVGDAYVANARSTYARRRNLVVAGLDRAGWPAHRPEGAFYALADVRALQLPDATIAAMLLDDTHVAVVPGSAFGAPGFVRLSFACSDDRLADGLERLANWRLQPT